MVASDISTGEATLKIFVWEIIFQVPSRTGEFYEKWRKDRLAVLLKFRQVGEVLKERIKNGKI